MKSALQRKFRRPTRNVTEASHALTTQIDCGQLKVTEDQMKIQEVSLICFRTQKRPEAMSAPGPSGVFGFHGFIAAELNNPTRT